MGTIADLIEYRNTKETTVVCEAKCKLPTRFGQFDMMTYRDTIDNQLHYVLVNGEVKPDVLVRVHLQNTFNDLLHSERDQQRSWPLEKAMERIGNEGGVLVLLGHQEHSSDILAKVKAFELEDNGRAVPAPWKARLAKWALARKFWPMWVSPLCVY